uniref:Reticulon-4-interacting protein 1, mitochondrial n=1 Tax=Talaromyces marneffei PM1 TaxID=1077442 RepID=A0A093XY26_TALMA
MKAVQILGDRSSPRIVTNDSMPEPAPKDSEILVRVYAAGITGDEVLWHELYNSPTRIPGHDISGVISAFGPEYAGPFRIGQEVLAFLAASSGGQGQADYVICHANELAPKPTSISHAQAAALPIPLLTAWEVIFDHGGGVKEAGMRVLVTGASGAVGRLAVQIASSHGAYVIALASARHHSTLKELGAHEVLDYNTPGWETQLQNVALVLDTVGGDILTKTWETIDESDGTIVTVGDPPPSWAFGKCQAAESTKWPNAQYTYFVVSPNAERLSKASGMIDAGAITPLEVMSFPFHEAEKAWSCARQRGRGHKVVIDFVG